MIKTFPAALEALYDMLDFIIEEASQSGFDEVAIWQIELAAEEALVNIICHGYNYEGGVIEINCETPKRRNSGLKIVIRDEGVAYNPLSLTRKVDPWDKIREEKLGGYGVFFILQIMDEVEYIRKDGINTLTLIKFC